MSDAQAMAARLKAEMEILRAQLAWTEQALFAVLNDEPVDGQYIHALTCSGDRTKPIGTVGVTCSCGLGRRYKELQQSLAAATTELERLEQENARLRRENELLFIEPSSEELKRQLDAAHEALRQAREFAYEVANGYDHDIDAHRYGTPCRQCSAQMALHQIDAALQSVPPQPQKETK